jgi:protein phosphatase
MALSLQSSARTDVGRIRHNNEDAFLELSPFGLYVLADGMGGHASGEVASYLAVETCRARITEALSGPAAATPGPDLLTQAIEAANEVVFREAAKNEAYRGMGTTIVALLREAGDVLTIAHVGDSRCYRLRQGLLEQLTEDHSLRNFYIKEYGYTPEEAAEAAESNVILRAIGLRESALVDISRQELSAGDLYLLCSDGLSDYVPDEEIARVLALEPELGRACAALIDLANAAGGYDNTTVVLVRVVDEG